MLPYQTLQEAEAALRRNLIFSETLWFNYSARKSDYFLYCHNVLFLILTFFVVPIPFLFLEIKCLAGFDKHKIQPSLLSDYWTGLPLPSGWEIISQLAVYFMTEDYTNHKIHRFLHSKWRYEKIHRVHREYTAPIGFAPPYAHWVGRRSLEFHLFGDQLLGLFRTIFIKVKRTFNNVFS